MIHIVCGMIGAGKSTYCEGKQGAVTDLDFMTSKEEQIEETLLLAKKQHRSVAHNHISNM